MRKPRLSKFEEITADGKIDGLLWYIHFGVKRPEKCRCWHCIDYKLKACGGGVDPYECMAKQTSTLTWEFSSDGLTLASFMKET